MRLHREPKHTQREMFQVDLEQLIDMHQPLVFLGPIESSLGLILLDGIPDARGQLFKVLEAGELKYHDGIMDRG